MRDHGMNLILPRSSAAKACTLAGFWNQHCLSTTPEMLLPEDLVAPRFKQCICFGRTALCSTRILHVCKCVKYAKNKKCSPGTVNESQEWQKERTLREQVVQEAFTGSVLCMIFLFSFQKTYLHLHHGVLESFLGVTLLCCGLVEGASRPAGGSNVQWHRVPQVWMVWSVPHALRLRSEYELNH